MASGNLFRTVVVVAVVGVVTSAPVGNDTGAMFYLSQFGYLPSNTRNLQYGALVDEGTFNKAITDFQEFAGLNPTGVLDEETLETMKLPRCGVKDKVGHGERSKRYALQGSRWKVKNLTYKLHKYPHGLDKSKVDAEIKRAFGVWSEYTDLKFEQKHSGQVHIDISFEKGEHGDGDPFDGPGGTLAHAYFPVFGGDAHFDAEERWTIDSYRGTNLFQVAAHEFGHSLGLSHSDVRSALMAPFYRGYEPVFTLDDDDIEGIQALYGEKTTKGSKPSESSPKPSPEKPPSSSDDAILCKDPSFDAIFNTADGNTYVFKGDKYWKVDEERVSAGYPKYINKGWPGLPSNIDAAFTYKNGKSYFFKGKQYWRFIGRQMEKGYPKDISEGFTGIPDNVDAAMVWSGNGKIYFFKGSKFWRFDPTQRPPVKATYPKLLSNWEGVPDSLDSAFQYTNGYTYFFKKGAYYRFNDRAFAVERVNPGFPRSTAWWWFGCKNAPKGTIGNIIDKSQGLSALEDDDVVEKNKPSNAQFDDVGHFAASEDDPSEDSGRPLPMDSESSTAFSVDPSWRNSATIHSVAAPVLLILVTLAVMFTTT